jgi:hypothetical protein
MFHYMFYKSVSRDPENESENTVKKEWAMLKRM